MNVPALIPLCLESRWQQPANPEVIFTETSQSLPCIAVIRLLSIPMLSVYETYFPLRWLLWFLFFFFPPADVKWGPQFASKILIEQFERVRIIKGKSSKYGDIF